MIKGSGLPCRFPSGCRLVFHPAIDTVVAIGEAALERDAHEQAFHGYWHIMAREFRPDFTRARTTSWGRHKT